MDPAATVTPSETRALRLNRAPDWEGAWGFICLSCPSFLTCTDLRGSWGKSAGQRQKEKQIH